jgi:hypothetical protein
MPSWPVLFLSACVITGTQLRWFLGVQFQPWLAQPDQMSWAILLDEAGRIGWRLDQFLPGPHDGGALLHSLLALALEPLGSPGLPALSIAALVVDTAVRSV